MKDLSVTEYIKKAFEYKIAGNYKQAIEFFYKALNADNESSEVLSEIASLYYKMNNTERAIDYYEQALLADPFNSEIKLNLALVYKYVGNIEKAVNLIESIYSKQPKAEYLSELLQCLYIQDKFEELIELYKHSQFQDSSIDSIYYYVALAYIELDDLNNAEGLLRKALNYNHSNTDAKYALANLLYNKKIYDESEILLLNILEDKICSKSYFLIGEINFAKNLLDKAINYYSIAIDIDNRKPLYFYSLAMAYSLKGFMREAEEYYLEAVKLSPNNLDYNYTLAYLYYQTKQIAKAKQKLSYILSINSHHVEALILKALIYSDNDDVINANRIIDEVLSRVSTNDFAFYVKALIYKKLSWWDKAIETIKRAIEIKPDSLEYLSELTKYYYESKLYKEARTLSYKIIELDPKYLFAYIQLAKVFIKLEDYETALKNIELALNFDNNSHEAYYLKAIVMKKSEINNFAIENAKIAISLAPDKIDYYEFVAQVYFLQKKYKEAYTYFKEASSLDIMKGDYKYYMAKCCEYLKDLGGATLNYSQAKRLNPANVFVSNEYADFLCSAGKYKQALDVIKSTLEYNLDYDEKKLLNKRVEELETFVSEKSSKVEKWFKEKISKLKAKDKTP